ncbi:unnamed protein product [Hymenolepis diminuta]|uniref:Uncharacterized protein n=1 Tax=Hymenolepis diminuta TaxID=6216 RepID=A0A564YBT9_HYMDI|nr:unnamed protein product [Hymenolepis diminuta]
MAFLIRITGPRETDENRPVSPGSAALEEMKMEDLIHQIFQEENITHDIWQTSRNEKYFVVEFPVLGRAFAEKVLDRLSYYNVGKTEDSNIMIIDPAAVVYKRPRSTGPQDIPMKHFQKFVNSLKSRLTVAQEPIMCIIFGLSLREKRMTIKGFRNTSVSLVICIIVGILFGIPAHFISMFQDVAPYPTQEMSGRGEAKALIASVIVAVASGVSVSFAILSNSLAAMIGNAISLSLLPPSVNCGQFFLLAVIALIDRPYVMKKIDTLDNNITVTVAKCQYRWIKEYNFYYVSNACDAPTEFAILGVVSFCLTLLNIILIIITGYIVNRLKDLVPQSFTNNETRRFYTKDLKEVRGNYDCVHRMKATDLATQAYQEYLRLNGGGYTEEEADQLTADFQAVMEGIGHDPHLQTITSWTHGGGNDFLAEFARATEFLTQAPDNLTISGNGTTGALPRVSVSSEGNGAYKSRHLMPCPRRQASCMERRTSSGLYPDVPRGVFSSQNTMIGSSRHRYLRQLAAIEDGGNHSGDNYVSIEAPSGDDQKNDSDDEPDESTVTPIQRHPYMQNQRHTRTGSFWRNLLSKSAFSSVQAPSRCALEAEPEPQDVNLDVTEKGNSVPWKYKRTADDVNDPPVGTTFGFQSELSCVPSSESEESINEHGISIRGINRDTHREPSNETEGPSQHNRISRSAFDVSAALSRNRSLASVSTIGGKFEVVPTIRKPQSTKNLGSYLVKDL